MPETNSDFELSQIGQIAVTVRDLPRAIEFYRDTLGLPLLFQAGAMAFFRCGSVRLMLATPEQDDQKFSSVIYYKVDSIETAFRVLSGRGVKFEGKPHVVAKLEDHDLWMAFFRDPDNNLLALMSEAWRQTV